MQLKHWSVREKRISKDSSIYTFALVSVHNHIFVYDLRLVASRDAGSSSVCSFPFPSIKYGNCSFVHWFELGSPETAKADDNSYVLILGSDRGFILTVDVPYHHRTRSPIQIIELVDAKTKKICRGDLTNIVAACSTALGGESLLICLDGTGTLLILTLHRWSRNDHRNDTTADSTYDIDLTFAKSQKLSLMDPSGQIEYSHFLKVAATSQWCAIGTALGTIVLVDLLQLMSRWEYGIDTTYLTTEVLSTGGEVSSHPSCRIPSNFSGTSPIIDIVLDCSENGETLYIAAITQNALLIVARKHLLAKAGDEEGPADERLGEWSFSRCSFPSSTIPKRMALGVRGCETIYVFCQDNAKAFVFLDLKIGLIPTILAPKLTVDPAKSSLMHRGRSISENLTVDSNGTLDISMVSPNLGIDGLIIFWSY